MTEQAPLSEQVIRPSYEQLVGSMPHPGVRDAWQATDNAARQTRDAMQKIHDNEGLSDKGKKEAAQGIIDRQGAKAREHYQQARARAPEAARSAYEFSIPMPDKQCYATSRAKDSGEMLAIQGEAERVARDLTSKSLQQLTKEASKNPRDEGIRGAVGSTVQALKGEYEKAMRRGGVEGKVLAHGVLRVADAVGVDKDAVVDDFRSDRHRRYVEESRQISDLRGSIPSGNDLTQNPYDTRRPGARGVGTYGSKNRAVASLASGREKLFQKKQRRPLWK